MTVLIPRFRSRLLLPDTLPFVDPRERRFWYCYRQNGTIPFDPLGTGNTQLLSDLALVPLGFWDVRRNLTLNGASAASLGDVKGDGTYGPAHVQATPANQPAWDGTSLNFDGSNDVMVTASALASLDLSVAPTALTDVLVADVPNVNFRVAASIGAAAGAAPNWLQEVRTGPLWQGVSDLLTSSGSAALPTPGSFHVFISTFSYVTSPSKKMTMNVQVPPGTMSTNAGASVGPETAGANFASIGANTAGTSGLAIRFRARIILPGLSTAQQAGIISTWASTYHFAVVT